MLHKHWRTLESQGWNFNEYWSRFCRSLIASRPDTSRTEKHVKNTIAFGVRHQFDSFRGTLDGEYITALWLTIHGLSERDTELAFRMFQTMSEWEFLLVDWSMSALIALGDMDAVGQYLAEFRADEGPK